MNLEEIFEKYGDENMNFNFNIYKDSHYYSLYIQYDMLHGKRYHNLKTIDDVIRTIDEYLSDL